MDIIFVRDFIVDDMYGIRVRPGQTGVLLDDVTGTVLIDDDDPDPSSRKSIVYGIVEGVQPSMYVKRLNKVPL